MLRIFFHLFHTLLYHNSAAIHLPARVVAPGFRPEDASQLLHHIHRTH
jgi:hypothetical protein